MKQRIYKIYKQENDNVLIDLSLKEVDGNYSLNEKVNNIELLNESVDDLLANVKELDVDQDTKKEIQKAILDKHMGVLEEKKLELKKMQDEKSKEINDFKDGSSKKLNENKEQMKKSMKEETNKNFDNFEEEMKSMRKKVNTWFE